MILVCSRFAKIVISEQLKKLLHEPEQNQIEILRDSPALIIHSDLHCTSKAHLDLSNQIRHKSIMVKLTLTFVLLFIKIEIPREGHPGVSLEQF